MHPNEALLRKGYEAFANADLETIQDLFADDVVFHVPGNNPISGEYKGKDEVLGFLGTLVMLSEGTFTAEVHDLLASDDHAVALTTNRAQRGSKTLEIREAAVYHTRDGKVTEVWFMPSDIQAEDEFWS